MNEQLINFTEILRNPTSGSPILEVDEDMGTRLGLPLPLGDFLRDYPSLQESRYNAEIVGMSTDRHTGVVKFISGDQVKYAFVGLDKAVKKPKFKTEFSGGIDLRQCSSACKLAVFGHFQGPTKVYKNEPDIDVELLEDFQDKLLNPEEAFPLNDYKKNVQGLPQPVKHSKQALWLLYRHHTRSSLSIADDKENCPPFYRILIARNAIGQYLLLGYGEVAREAYRTHESPRGQSATGFILVFDQVDTTDRLVAMLAHAQTPESMKREKLSQLFQHFDDEFVYQAHDGSRIDPLTDEQGTNFLVVNRLDIPRLRPGMIETPDSARKAREIIFPDLSEAIKAAVEFKRINAGMTIVAPADFSRKLVVTAVNEQLLTQLKKALEYGTLEESQKIATDVDITLIDFHFQSEEYLRKAINFSRVVVNQISSFDWQLLTQVYHATGVMMGRPAITRWKFDDPRKLYAFKGFTTGDYALDNFLIVFDSVDLSGYDLSQLHVEAIGITPKVILPQKLLFGGIKRLYLSGEFSEDWFNNLIDRLGDANFRGAIVVPKKHADYAKSALQGHPDAGLRILLEKVEIPLKN